MFERFVTFGVRQLFGGARRGQPWVTAFGAAVSLWGLSRRLRRDNVMVYSRKLKDGETIRITQLRGSSVVNEEA